jgi:hypothetical protein
MTDTQHDLAEPKDQRRTKRRYAHELYPHAEEGETRPLSVELPYLYARAQGFETDGTSWFDSERTTPEQRTARTLELLAARRVALLADALAQGMTGDEAWAWADALIWEYDGSGVWERAEFYGVDPYAIKSYPCGPEPMSHNHYSSGTHGIVTSIPMPESECLACTEPVPGEKTRPLTADDFEMRHDADHTYPFFEDENGNGIWGFGHQDKAEFARLANEYDELATGMPTPEDAYTADDVSHTFYVAYLPDGARDDEWLLRQVAEGTPDSYPGTVISR